MTRITRAFIFSGLAALLGAATLHTLVLAGIGRAWSPMIHLTIFGWISALILAVNYHTLPVFSGREFPFPGLITVHWTLFSGGVAISGISLLGGWREGMGVGISLQLIASLLFIANLLLLFLRGPRRAHGPPIPPNAAQRSIDRLGTRATKTAAVCLPLGLSLLLAQHQRWIGGTWLLAAEHLVVLGWVVLMIVGVGYHVLPRFSGRNVRRVGWARIQLLVHHLALALIVLALGWGWPGFFAVAGLLMTLALGLFVWTIWPTLVVFRQQPMSISLMLKERGA